MHAGIANKRFLLKSVVEKWSQHSWRSCYPQFCLPGKRPIIAFSKARTMGPMVGSSTAETAWAEVVTMCIVLSSYSDRVFLITVRNTSTIFILIWTSHSACNVHQSPVGNSLNRPFAQPSDLYEMGHKSSTVFTDWSSEICFIINDNNTRHDRQWNRSPGANWPFKNTNTTGKSFSRIYFWYSIHRINLKSSSKRRS